jgi:hypothetical protein
MTVSIPWIQSTLDFIMNVILICLCRPQVFEFCHIFKRFISSPYILFLFGWRDMIICFVFRAFISRATSLLASKRVSVFSFLVFILSPNNLTSSAYTNSWCVPFISKPTSFSWTFLIVYSMVKWKNNGDRASPCFRPFWIGNFWKKIFLMCTY